MRFFRVAPLARSVVHPLRLSVATGTSSSPSSAARLSSTIGSPPSAPSPSLHVSLFRPHFDFSTQSPEAIQSHLMSFTSKEEWKAVLGNLSALRTKDRAEFDESIGFLADCIDQPSIDINYLRTIFTWNTLPLINGSHLRLSPRVRSVFGETVTKSSIMVHLLKLTTAYEWGMVIGVLAELPVDREDEEFFKFIIKGMHETQSLEGLIRTSKILLKVVSLPSLRINIEDYIIKRNKRVNNRLIFSPFADSWRSHADRIMVGEVSSHEIRHRAVMARQVVTNTKTIHTLSSKLEWRPAVVLTGESGSGKTLAAIIGSTLREKQFAVYLGSAEGFVWKGPDVQTDADKQRLDEALSEYLEGRISVSTGHSLVDDDMVTIEKATLSIILDDLGSRREVLQSYLRIASEPYSTLRGNIEKSFGVWRVRFVAVGTGCVDVIPGFSRFDTYTTIFTSPCDGHAIWKCLLSGRKTAEANRVSALWPYVCALAGGLQVDGVVSEHVLREVESHPEGIVHAGTGRALVRNARTAAFLASQLSQLKLPSYALLSAPALIEASLPYIAGLHHQSIHTFVNSWGALSQRTDDDRMQLVAESLALALSCTDADIPSDMFDRLSSKAGVLTSCGIEVRNPTYPIHGRVIESGEHVKRRVAIEDGGRRYRVSESMAIMYLTQFGVSRRPARTSDAFELSVFDFVKLALVPASIVAGWSRGQLKQLSCPSPSAGKRCGLFELLVEAFTAAGVGEVSVSEVPKEGGEAATATVVLCPDDESGADMMVMCRGHFAIRIKIHSHGAASIEKLKGEFEKMGAPSFDKAAAHVCVASSACASSPSQYYAIVRCIGPNDVADERMQQELSRGGHADCRYIEVRAGTRAFSPLPPVSNMETKPALLSISYFSKEK